MAYGPLDPFTPGPTADPTAGVAPDTFDKIKNEWSAWVDQPGNRSFLLQTGLALMQPPSFGDTATSQIGRAIGSGAEAATREKALDYKFAEQESKTEANVARADAASTRANAATDRLGLEHFRQQMISNRAEDSGLIRLQQQYISQQNAANKAYNDRQRKWEEGEANKRYNKGVNPVEKPGPREQYKLDMPFEEWLQFTNPGLAAKVLKKQPKPQKPQQAEPDEESD
jgi:hypothetical protein